MPAGKKGGGLRIPTLKCDLLQLLYRVLHSKRKLMWLNLPIAVNMSTVFKYLIKNIHTI